MLGINDFIIVSVVSNQSAKSSSTHNVRVDALNTIEKETTGNSHKRSVVQKQAYPAELCVTVRQAYGLTGTNYATHSAFLNGKPIDLDDTVSKNSEITLVQNDHTLQQAIPTIATHRILPRRTGS